MNNLPAIKVSRKNGNESLHDNENQIPFNLLSFWQWSSSDLVGNTLRGMLAEYIIASAVGSEKGTRTEWDAFDIETPDKTKIEVKSSAYIQSWSQEKLSTISFGIQPTQGWDAKTNTYSSQRVRQSDIYVFCVLAHKDKKTIDPLNLDQWVFYIVATKTLNKILGNQKTITLSSLEKLKPIKVKYGSINETITSLSSSS
jgi:hypothetical protein